MEIFLIEKFAERSFCKSILDLAQAYGSLSFWTENFSPGSNPDAVWRALMVVAALNEKQMADRIVDQLDSTDNRVRAWACTTLAILQYKPALARIEELAQDSSQRVRQRAREASRSLQGNSAEHPGADSSIPQTDIQILVSQDSQSAREFYKEFLENLGFCVHLSSTEADTVDTACVVRPNVILTDNQKNHDNLSGLNTTWDLCRLNQLRETVIFMVAGNLLEPIFLWSGGDEYFTKPLDVLILAEKLKEYF
jgi:CheY-like chemotaxis protein